MQLSDYLPIDSLRQDESSLLAQLSIDRFSRVDFAAFEYNTLLGPRRFAEFRPLNPGWQLMPPSLDSNVVEPQLDAASDVLTTDRVDEEVLLEQFAAFFEPLQDRGIAIQCSGGLDSSIIASILRCLGIKFALVGLRTDRHEFRTETYIQKSLRHYCRDVVFIDYETVLPMSRLREVPPHVIPSLSALTYVAEHALARACRDVGAGVIVSGSGGDMILAEAAPTGISDWPIHIVRDWWLQHYVYKPIGIDLVYPFGNPSIVRVLRHLRTGQDEDLRKLWARHYFRHILPEELVSHTYKADFWGIHIDGLRQNLADVRALDFLAYELTASEFFSPESFASLTSHDLQLQDKELHLRVESRAALATWVCSVLKPNDQPQRV